MMKLSMQDFVIEEDSNLIMDHLDSTKDNNQHDEAFSFFSRTMLEYFETCRNSKQSKTIMYFLYKMPNDQVFNKWCILKWEVQEVSFNL
jgi:hypothetical protein